MTPALVTYFVGAALSLVGVACLLSSLFLRAPGVERPWRQFWAPADSFRGAGLRLNRGGFALTLAGIAMVLAALAWHRYFPA